MLNHVEVLIEKKMFHDQNNETETPFQVKKWANRVKTLFQLQFLSGNEIFSTDID